jgi:uncharacterized membrane protein YeaQ/YmgE (transglycosylase-associated protein family)
MPALAAGAPTRSGAIVAGGNGGFADPQPRWSYGESRGRRWLERRAFGMVGCLGSATTVCRREWEETSMSNESILVILLVGLIAGWLAGQIVRGTGYGIVADICIGIIGALIGSWLLPQLGIHLGAGIVSAIIAATIGAILLLVILRLVNRGGRW